MYRMEDRKEAVPRTKEDLKGMSMEQLKGRVIRECPSEYGLKDLDGCDGSGEFSCQRCWEVALDEMEGGGMNGSSGSH